MTNYAIVRIDKNEDDVPDVMYLNHAYLSSSAFGSPEMAWTTPDSQKAELMLFKIKSSQCPSEWENYRVEEI